MPGRLILASSSPQRLNLLAQIGITPDKTMPPNISEVPSRAASPRQLAFCLAVQKSQNVANIFPKDFVLAADTVVACGRRILDKAKTTSDAAAHLNLLSGRRHRVYSGVALAIPNGSTRGKTVMTQVIFKQLHRLEINSYLDSNEWRGKAGAYAIQGLAGGFAKRINGSYSNVVGLPLYETLTLLKGVGLK